MQDLLDEINKLPKPKPKVHTVCIQGQKVVVSLQKKLEVIRHGEDAYEWKTPTEFVLKPPPKVLKTLLDDEVITESDFKILKKCKQTYSKYNGDIDDKIDFKLAEIIYKTKNI